MPSPARRRAAREAERPVSLRDLPPEDEHRTDAGNARRFAEEYRRDLIFVPGLGWFVWDGCRFAKGYDAQVWRWAMDHVRKMIGRAQGYEEVEERKAWTRWALASESRARINAIVALAQYMDPIATRADELDQHPMLFNTTSGTLDLETETLRPHDRADVLTKVAGCAYDPDATCPRWLQFLNEIFAGNQQIIAFVQRVCGYLMTGLTSEQVFFFLYGTGANGKSVFLEVLRAIFGDYACVSDSAIFMQQRNGGGSSHTEGIARLRGARTVTSVELGPGKAWDEPLIKRLTGSDTIAARDLNVSSIEFPAQFKLLFAGNHKPKVNGQDEAIWRRIILIPFAVTIPASERDPHLKEKLIAEGTGILAWCFEGLRAWKRVGLSPPETVLLATKKYRNDEDVIGGFLEQRCELGAFVEIQTELGSAPQPTDHHYVVPFNELFATYRVWAAENLAEPISKRAFSTKLAEKEIQTDKKGRGKNVRVLGLRLLTPEELESPSPSEPESERVPW